jgi:hypothetical protein
MEAALDALVQALQRHQRHRTILFRSAARGEADADSDLDVLVIKDIPEPFVQRLEAMARLCPSLGPLDRLDDRGSSRTRLATGVYVHCAKPIAHPVPAGER